MMLINLFNKIPTKNYYVHYVEHGSVSRNAYGSIDYNLIYVNVIGCNTKRQADNTFKNAKKYGYEPHLVRHKPRFGMSTIEKIQSQITKEYMIYYFDCDEDWLR